MNKHPYPTILIPRDQLYIDKDLEPCYGPEMTEAQFEKFVKDIEVNGMLTPIHVRQIQPYRYQILNGRHRFKAATRLEWTTVTCCVLTTKQESIAAIFENIHRRHFTPEEILEAQRLETKAKTAIEKAHPDLLTLSQEYNLKSLLPADIWQHLLNQSEEVIEEFVTNFRAKISQAFKTTPAYQSKAHPSPRKPSPPIHTEHQHIIETLQHTVEVLTKENEAYQLALAAHQHDSQPDEDPSPTKDTTIPVIYKLLNNRIQDWRQELNKSYHTVQTHWKHLSPKEQAHFLARINSLRTTLENYLNLQIS